MEARSSAFPIWKIEKKIDDFVEPHEKNCIIDINKAPMSLKPTLIKSPIRKKCDFYVKLTLKANIPLVDLYLIFEKSIWKNQVRRTGFLVYFELDFYCLRSLQKSRLSNLIFQNSSTDQQGDSSLETEISQLTYFDKTICQLKTAKSKINTSLF